MLILGIILFPFILLRTSMAEYCLPGSLQNLEKVKVAFYYESLCPACSDFVVKQLKPAVHYFGDRLNLSVIPFGFANYQDNGTFKCHHGPSECLGNIIQNCALSDTNLTNVQKVNYLACEEMTLASTKNDLSCVVEAGISDAKVTELVTSQEGINLQLEAEIATKATNPPYVPYITVNGEPSQDAISDLMTVLNQAFESTC